MAIKEIRRKNKNKRSVLINMLTRSQAARLEGKKGQEGFSSRDEKRLTRSKNGNKKKSGNKKSKQK
ncbi:MAG: hypothetical protein PHD49_01255 [Candidatus Shapirobacteria bacterium]|nr:hypothetical protein [Candidatus Shapirobacteria bacterium]